MNRFFFLLTSISNLLLGVSVANSNAPQEQDWILVNDAQDHMEALFPYQPSHLTFSIPIEKSEQLGHLEVYSTPIQKGLVMLCILSLPEYQKKEFEAHNFQKTFYNYIIKRMFYSPKLLKNYDNFNHKNTTIEGEPGLEFSFSYLENQLPRHLTGIAILKNSKLFIFFYIAADKNHQKEVMDKFLHSFRFTD